MPIIDTKVYSKNQVFRIVESWKFTDTPTKDDVLHFQPEREHCMTNLLSTLVSNVRGVTTWLSEHNDAPEQDIEKLLHAAGVDGLLSNGAGFYLAYGTACCLCSHLTATERSSMYTVTEDDGKWKLVCKHPRCAAIGADTRLLGRISSILPARHVTKVLPQALRTLKTSQMFANRWKYQRTLSADSQLFNECGRCTDGVAG